jgi:hypothetical protein
VDDVGLGEHVWHVRATQAMEAAAHCEAMSTQLHDIQEEFV